MCRLRNRQRTLVLAVEPTSPLPTEIDISPGGDVTDMVERSIDMPTPELARRTIRRTISGGDISGGLPLRNNSPEYVHVESPRESPTLGRAPPIDQSSPWVRTQSSPEAVQVASPTFSPVWVRVDSPDSSPVLSSPRAPPSSPILAQVPLKESVSARSLPVAPLGRFLSRSYTNPYRQDLTFVERQLPSSSNRLRLQFKWRDTRHPSCEVVRSMTSPTTDDIWNAMSSVRHYPLPLTDNEFSYAASLRCYSSFHITSIFRAFSAGIIARQNYAPLERIRS